MNRPAPALLFFAAALLAAAPCAAQLMYYDADNARIAAANSFSTQNTLIAGGSLYGSNIYTSGWFRNNPTQRGMYGHAYGGGYFYPTSGNSWSLTGSGNYPQLRFRDSHEGTIRGYLYSDPNFGLLHSGGNWMFYVPSDSQRVYFPSASGVTFGSYNVRQAQTTFGSISLYSGAGSYSGMGMGTDGEAPIVMFSGLYGGVWYPNGSRWENLINGSGWTFAGNFRVMSGFILYSTAHPTQGPRRALTKVIVQEAVTSQIAYSYPTAPSCPAGSSDQGVWQSYATSIRSCLFGSSGGWGGYSNVP